MKKLSFLLVVALLFSQSPVLCQGETASSLLPVRPDWDCGLIHGAQSFVWGVIVGLNCISFYRAYKAYYQEEQTPAQLEAQNQATRYKRVLDELNRFNNKMLLFFAFYMICKLAEDSLCEQRA